jgi:hypothetical protein
MNLKSGAEAANETLQSCLGQCRQKFFEPDSKFEWTEFLIFSLMVFTIGVLLFLVVALNLRGKKEEEQMMRQQSAVDDTNSVNSQVQEVAMTP